ncbi:VOC family protein [Streptomyces malaysiensis]
MTDIADERARRLHRHHRRSRHPADPGSEHLASPRAGHLAAARIHERGGTIGVGPLPFGPGHQAILRDPDGGLSTVTTV